MLLCQRQHRTEEKKQSVLNPVLKSECQKKKEGRKDDGGWRRGKDERIHSFSRKGLDWGEGKGKERMKEKIVV